MNEIINALSGIPVNAYLMVVIALQFWQNKNRDTIANKKDEKSTEAMNKFSIAVTELTTLFRAK